MTRNLHNPSPRPAASLLSRARLWLHATLHRPRLESDMDAEIQFHLDARAQDLAAQGLPPKLAARQARLEFGPIATTKDGIRSALGLRWIDELLADLRYSTRLLRKSPGFTAIAVSSLALAIAIGATPPSWCRSARCLGT